MTNIRELYLRLCMSGVFRKVTEKQLFKCFFDYAKSTATDDKIKAYDAKKPMNHYYIAKFGKYQNGVRVGEVALPSLPVQLIGMIFQPIHEQLVALKDSEDWCGHYFFPYCIMEAHLPWWGGYVGNHFEIQWDDSSYLANKDKYPQFDYSWLEKSTFHQDLDLINQKAGVPFLNERV